MRKAVVVVRPHVRGGKPVRGYVQHRRESRGKRRPKYAEKRQLDTGRTVYVYPEEAVEQRQRQKLRQVKQLAASLPDILKRIDRALDAPDTPLEKTIAAVVALIDRCMFRIGTERYAEEHGTYGVTTLRTDHVAVRGNVVEFSFRGKHGVDWDRAVTDPRLAAYIRHLAEESPDGRLFWYQAGGRKLPLQGHHVNRWLKQHWGITAKTFRTYHATRLAFEKLRERSRPPRSEPMKKSEARRIVREVVEEVAQELGHTPSTCRKHYIMPQLIEDFLQNGGRLSAGVARRVFG